MKGPKTSTLKEKADISLQKAKETILSYIPNDEILSIYVKGSYVQNELQEDSDVDVVVILKSEKYLSTVYELTEKFGNSTEPPFQIIAYTMDELLTGQWSTNRPKKATAISIFVKHLDKFPLLYGTKPEEKLFTRTDIKDLTALISFFEDSFLKDYENGSVDFKGLVKIVLWLVEREQRALGIVPEYSWQKLADSIKDENHIIHLALKWRRQKEISKEEKRDFLEKLKDYLVFLKDKYQK
ncbi:MAG: nucleotidyltransferase domain-containing protein [bacterium]